MNPNEQKAREYLLMIKKLDEAAKAVEAQEATLEADLTRITARYSQAPGGGRADPAESIIRLIKISKIRREAFDTYVSHKTRCIDLINLTHYPRLLTALYIEYKSMTDVAAELFYSRSKTIRLHSRALNEFAKFLAVFEK